MIFLSMNISLDIIENTSHCGHHRLTFGLQPILSKNACGYSSAKILLHQATDILF